VLLIIFFQCGHGSEHFISCVGILLFRSTLCMYVVVIVSEISLKRWFICLRPVCGTIVVVWLIVFSRHLCTIAVFLRWALPYRSSIYSNVTFGRHGLMLHLMCGVLESVFVCVFVANTFSASQISRFIISLIRNGFSWLLDFV
jgi:hypothetical protein